MTKLAAFLCLVFVFAMPCQSGTETVIASVAECRSIGGIGFWSNPAIWYPMQVPDNGRPPGTTYDVSLPRSNCPWVHLDQSVTINSFWTMDMLEGADRKPAKLRGSNVSFTVLRDARIDELNMTNVKFDIGGLLWISWMDGWRLTDSKIKTQNYRQDAYTGNNYLRTVIEATGKFVVTDFAWAELKESSLETQDLELSNGSLLLYDGSIVKVKGNFQHASSPYTSLRIQLNGRTSFTVEGNAQLNGALSPSFTDGYVPSIGEEFPILRCKGAISGGWTLRNPPPLPAGRTWQLVADAHNVSLKVISAP